MRRRTGWIILLSLLVGITTGCTSTPQLPSRQPGEAPAPATTAPTESTGTPVTTKAGTLHDFKPQTNFGGSFLSDNRLFWLGWTKSDSSDRLIYMRDLATGVVKAVVKPTDEYVLGYPAATGDWVVVSESPLRSQKAWRLISVNLKTGERRLLGAADAGAVRLTFAADAGKVVWIEADPNQGRARLLLHDLNANQTRTLLEVQSPEDLESVDISEGNIVYTKVNVKKGTDASIQLSSDVHLYNLQTGADEALTTAHDAWQVRISGSELVWKAAASNGDYGNVALFSLATRTTRMITTDGGSRGITAPSIASGIVTWREALGANRIPVYLIDQGQTLTLDSGEVFAPLARGKNLVWRWEPAPDDARIRWVEPKN